MQVYAWFLFFKGLTLRKVPKKNNTQALSGCMCPLLTCWIWFPIKGIPGLIGLKQSLPTVRTNQSWLEDEGVLFDRSAGSKDGGQKKGAVKTYPLSQVFHERFLEQV